MTQRHALTPVQMAAPSLALPDRELHSHRTHISQKSVDRPLCWMSTQAHLMS